MSVATYACWVADPRNAASGTNDATGCPATRETDHVPSPATVLVVSPLSNTALDNPSVPTVTTGLRIAVTPGFTVADALPEVGPVRTVTFRFPDDVMPLTSVTVYAC